MSRKPQVTEFQHLVQTLVWALCLETWEKKRATLLSYLTSGPVLWSCCPFPSLHAFSFSRTLYLHTNTFSTHRSWGLAPLSKLKPHTSSSEARSSPQCSTCIWTHLQTLNTCLSLTPTRLLREKHNCLLPCMWTFGVAFYLYFLLFPDDVPVLWHFPSLLHRLPAFALRQLFVSVHVRWKKCLLRWTRSRKDLGSLLMHANMEAPSAYRSSLLSPAFLPPLTVPAPWRSLSSLLSLYSPFSLSSVLCCISPC